MLTMRVSRFTSKTSTTAVINLTEKRLSGKLNSAFSREYMTTNPKSTFRRKITES